MTIHYATVTAVVGNKCKVTFVGEDTQSNTVYYQSASYTPTLNDKVALIEDSKGKYLLIGKVI